VGKFPDWHRPKLTETQLGGEDNRLARRGLFPKVVRADLICALASMEAANITAACRALSACIGVSDKLIDNILNGRMPIYDTMLIGLYGPGTGKGLPIAWAAPTSFGPLTDHAITAGLINGPITTPKPTLSPDPGAGAPTPPNAAPTPEIVALVATPRPSDDLPAAPALSRAAPDAAPQIAAPPAFFATPVTVRPLLAPPPFASNPPDPLAVAELLLAGRLAAALEELAVRQRRFEEADLRAQSLRIAVAELRAARADVAQDRAAA